MISSSYSFLEVVAKGQICVYAYVRWLVNISVREPTSRPFKGNGIRRFFRLPSNIRRGRIESPLTAVYLTEIELYLTVWVCLFVGLPASGAAFVF